MIKQRNNNAVFSIVALMAITFSTIIGVIITLSHHYTTTTTKTTTTTATTRPRRNLLSPIITETTTTIKDISTPADMWTHYVVNNNYDTKPTTPKKERPPLPNCCRDLHSSHPLRTNSPKFVGACTSTDYRIRYAGPGSEYAPSDLLAALDNINDKNDKKRPRDLILIGDSVTRQWFEQLSCYLGRWDSWKGFATDPVGDHMTTIERDILSALVKHHRDDNSLDDGFTHRVTIVPHNPTTMMAESRLGCFTLPSQQRIIFHNANDLSVEESLHLLKFYDTVYPTVLKRSRPLFLLNGSGLHYNLFDYPSPTAAELTLKRDVKMMAGYCRETGGMCLFRETSPQHFETEGGEFPGSGSVGRYCMKEAPATFDMLKRWRNEVLHDAVGEVLLRRSGGEGGVVTIMPLFDRLAYLNFAHVGKYPNVDCTHFFMNPEFWEPWHVSLTQVLRDVMTAVG